MIKTKITALTLAGLMAVATGSAFAGSTGPTNPADATVGPKNSSQGPATNGTPKMPDNTSTPGTKGTGSSNGNGSAAEGGMTNGKSMGTDNNGAAGTNGTSGSTGSK